MNEERFVDAKRCSLEYQNREMSQNTIQKLNRKSDNFNKKQRNYSFIILNITQKSVFFVEKKVLDHSSY